MFDHLNLWAIEVHRDQDCWHLDAQVEFIRDFGRWLYADARDSTNLLSRLRFPYFTRIFDPRQEMGTTVRLCFFVDDADREAVERRLNEKLQQYRDRGKVFQVKTDRKPGVTDEAKQKGAERFPEQYYTFMHTLSQVAVQMFQDQPDGHETDLMVWTWSHNVFNLLRGYPSDVLEVDAHRLHRL